MADVYINVSLNFVVGHEIGYYCRWIACICTYFYDYCNSAVSQILHVPISEGKINKINLTWDTK